MTIRNTTRRAATSCSRSRAASASSPSRASRRSRPAARPQDADDPLAPKQPHFAPRAKRVIFLCMEGGPSHVDTFDYKPKLGDDDGKAMGRRRRSASSSARRGSSASTARADSGSASSSRRLRTTPIALPAARDDDRSSRPSAGVPQDAHGELPVRAARRSGRGRSTASGRPTGTCRASSR